MNTWQRYKTDENYRRNIETRKKIMESIRDFFASEGFIEIEAPLLARSPGMEPNLAPFKTTSGEYLITSPEYSCKKMLAAGIPKLFSLGKVFRNEEPRGGTHNAEFTMLEWYRVGTDYTAIMNDVERLIAHCATSLRHSGESRNPRSSAVDPVFQRGDGLKWNRVSVKDAFGRIGLNLDQLLTRDTMAKAASDKGYAVTPNDSFDDCFFKIFLTEIEPKLGIDRPTILYDYPIQMAALSRAKPEDPRYAERFEVYANGLELANAFSELTDPVEQRKRFEDEAKERARLGKDVPPIDEDLLTALGQIKSAAGIALGVDRLVMLLVGAASIEDVMLFPARELFDEK